MANPFIDPETGHYMPSYESQTKPLPENSDPYTGFPYSVTAMPWWYDAKGQIQKSYAHSGFGDPQVENCSCPACSQMKEYQQSQVANEGLRQELRTRAYEIAGNLLMYRSADSFNDKYHNEELERTAHTIYNNLLDILSAKQKEWHKRLETIQIEHMMSEAVHRYSQTDIRRKRQAEFGPGGRLFRAGEETDEASLPSTEVQETAANDTTVR